MTQAEIQRQIDAIRQASEEARQSPERARQFLIDAGIMKQEAFKTDSKKIETKSKS
jgi:hypothetical protein